MSLSTRNVKESKVSKTINPGNTVAKINDITLKKGYNEGSYILELHVESQPVQDPSFEGFYIDKDNPSKGRYAGQVGKIRYSQYAYESKTLPSGVKIDRDQSILKAILLISKSLGCLDEVNEVEADTIEEFINKVKPIIIHTGKFMHYCVAGKAYTNKEGYTAYDLFLPKATGGKYVMTDSEDSVVTFTEKDHIIAEKKKTENVDSFEPKASSSDFDF